MLQVRLTAFLAFALLSACNPYETPCGWECVREGGTSTHTGRLLLEGQISWTENTLRVQQGNSFFEIDLQPEGDELLCLEENVDTLALVAFPVMRGRPRVSVSVSPIPATGPICLLSPAPLLR